MKVIIAGSRTITDCTVVQEAIYKSKFEITEVVSGNARGVDRCGEWWAAHNKIPIKRFLANWEQYAQRAGFIRNMQMAEYGEALIAVWDGESRGTKMMIRIAEEKGLKLFVYLAGEQLGEKPKTLPTTKPEIMADKT